MATKICFISDTHCSLDKINIPEADLLIHAGDLTYKGSIFEIKMELEILQKKTKGYKKIILIAGNHDWLAEEDPDLMRQLCSDHGITYLQDEMTEFNGLKIYGSPWSPEFCSWAFNVPRGAAIKKYWDLIPDNTDILVTHGPPYGFLDQIKPEGQHLGCEELTKAIERIKPQIHAFGHIHGSYNNCIYNNIKLINASICNEQYKPINKPYIVEVYESK